MQVQGSSKLYTGVWQVLALFSVAPAGLQFLSGFVESYILTGHL